MLTLQLMKTISVFCFWQKASISCWKIFKPLSIVRIKLVKVLNVAFDL